MMTRAAPIKTRLAAITTIPWATLPQDMSCMLFITLARIRMAEATRRTPTAADGAVGGMEDMAIPIRIKLPAMTVIPLPMFSHETPDTSMMALARILMAVA